MTPWALRHGDRRLECVPTNAGLITGLQFNAGETPGFIGQLKTYMKYQLSILTFAGHNNFLLSVQVVFVALGVAAVALEGRRGPKDVPQGSSADLTT